ncbi:hypothetical protein OF829_18375 [Sphingomonas sp. LB-2]|uniref:hypothetical protein n=1 Tax=Sphingomonas caeni TaxID=2984949 RepID=UPI002230B440|nr:hypothetical protein [Sphingomonas caeni]MCW3849208.1 hypothetical protein [Sphingomonas caeni]
MTILLALAMMAQDAPLNAEAERAMGCASAVAGSHAGEADPPLLKITAQFSYYVMVAAKADPGGGPYVDRVNALVAVVQGRPVPSQAAAQSRMAECDRLYPLARTDAAVTLPADAYQRSLTCYGSVMVMYGAALGLDRMGKGKAELQRVSPAFDYYSAQAPDLMRQHGITATGTGAELDRVMQASLAIGNSYAITERCIAQLPKT